MAGSDGVRAVLEAQAVRLGSRPFLALPDATLTYAEADELATRVACGLTNLGTVPATSSWLVVPTRRPPCHLHLSPEARRRRPSSCTPRHHGDAQGVLWSRACEANWGRSYGDELVPPEEGEAAYCCLPLAHATCQGTTLAVLHRGGSITIESGFSPYRFWRRMRDAEPVMFSFVGTILSVLARRPPQPDDADSQVSGARLRRPGRGMVGLRGALRAAHRRRVGTDRDGVVLDASRPAPPAGGHRGPSQPRFEARSSVSVTTGPTFRSTWPASCGSAPATSG